MAKMITLKSGKQVPASMVGKPYTAANGYSYQINEDGSVKRLGRAKAATSAGTSGKASGDKLVRRATAEDLRTLPKGKPASPATRAGARAGVRAATGTPSKKPPAVAAGRATTTSNGTTVAGVARSSARGATPAASTPATTPAKSRLTLREAMGRSAASPASQFAGTDQNRMRNSGSNRNPKAVADQNRMTNSGTSARMRAPNAPDGGSWFGYQARLNKQQPHASIPYNRSQSRGKFGRDVAPVLTTREAAGTFSSGQLANAKTTIADPKGKQMSQQARSKGQAILDAARKRREQGGK